MPRILTAVIDNLTNDIAMPITIHSADAAAIRFFGDVATSEQAQHIGKHIHDFALYSLGTLNEDLTITPEKRLLLTGSQWAAAQATRTEGNK